MSTRKAFCILIGIFLINALEAQIISLADFRLETDGVVPEGTEQPQFATRGTLAGRFVPVSWIHIRAQTSLSITDTELFFHPLPENAIPGTLNFDGANIYLPSMLDSPLNFSIFTGFFDDPSSDSLLRDLLKIEIPSPEFHGKPAGMAFSPENRITGTGLALTTVPGNQNSVLGMYGYWNARTDSEASSTFDIRFGAVTNSLQFNTFGGISVLLNSATANLRGGLTSLFGAGTNNELYTEIGIRRYSFGASDNDRYMYFLFEPRLHLNKTDLVLSFFSSPILQTDTSGALAVNGNYLGGNILAGYGNLRAERFRLGMSLLSALNPENPGTLTPFSFSVSPFYSVMISDFLFDVTTIIKPLMFETPYSMIELMLSLKAVY